MVGDTSDRNASGTSGGIGKSITDNLTPSASCFSITMPCSSRADPSMGISSSLSVWSLTFITMARPGLGILITGGIPGGAPCGPPISPAMGMGTCLFSSRVIRTPYWPPSEAISSSSRIFWFASARKLAICPAISGGVFFVTKPLSQSSPFATSTSLCTA